MARLLLVEDNSDLAFGLRTVLEFEGHEVEIAEDGEKGLERARDHNPDLVILDLMLPGKGGYEVLRELRGGGVRTPVLILTARSQESDVVMGFDLGADDYVTKPFSPRELATRVKVLLRRRAPRAKADEVLRVGDLVIEPERHRCHWAGVEVSLTVLELAILATLARRPGRVFTRGQVVDLAWGPGHAVSDRTVDSHVRRIRSKLRGAGGDPVETVHGLGYRLREG